MDRRLTPFSGRIGHVSLQGRMTDVPLVEGSLQRVTAPLVTLRAKPRGAIDRQLLLGAELRLIDSQDDQGFVQSLRDGYCGWVPLAALGDALGATHVVASPATHAYPAPRVQAEPPLPLWLNARLQITDEDGAWSLSDQGWVPTRHLRPLDQPEADPVSVAERLRGAPYLWGGNSVAGVDCSGLVQLAFHACGRDMAADSDLQALTGQPLAGLEALQRGDLMFWKGHVALIAGPDRILHANGHTMDVAHEGLHAAITRIAAQGGGPVTALRRP